jgi:hypothetical protein
MILPNSGLENHPAGTGDLNAIVNGNWQQLENALNPAFGITASQTTTAVVFTSGILQAGDVGGVIRWADNTEVFITAVVSSTQATVSISQTKTSQAVTLYHASATVYDMFARALTKESFNGLTDAQMLQWDGTAKRFKRITKPGYNLTIGQILFGGGPNADMVASANLKWDDVLKVLTTNGQLALTNTLQIGLVTQTASTSTTQLDGAVSNCFLVNLQANTTISMVNIKPGARYTVILKQDATGSRTVAWAGTFVYPNGNPTINSAANAYSFAEALGISSSVLVGGKT